MLGALIEVLSQSGSPLTALEIAEALWLASHTSPGQTAVTDPLGPRVVPRRPGVRTLRRAGPRSPFPGPTAGASLGSLRSRSVGVVQAGGAVQTGRAVSVPDTPAVGPPCASLRHPTAIPTGRGSHPPGNRRDCDRGTHGLA